ncbi:protein EFR3 homolog B-like, partial [Camarhynchus parvulus]|uniref:protein EFR3 homolog B-like n=1 Tax=Geospiza parvula TaxID=87175 RepID=UPI001238308F
MEALDQLLLACHCQSINLFVESFLTMVAKLLESDKPDLQILGTNSFVKFANIEEDTPSYHRSYDFFVSLQRDVPLRPRRPRRQGQDPDVGDPGPAGRGAG